MLERSVFAFAVLALATSGAWAAQPGVQSDTIIQPPPKVAPKIQDAAVKPADTVPAPGSTQFLVKPPQPAVEITPKAAKLPAQTVNLPPPPGTGPALPKAPGASVPGTSPKAPGASISGASPGGGTQLPAVQLPAVQAPSTIDRAHNAIEAARAAELARQIEALQRLHEAQDALGPDALRPGGVGDPAGALDEAAAGTQLEGKRPGTGGRADLDQLIHDMLLGRGPSFSDVQKGFGEGNSRGFSTPGGSAPPRAGGGVPDPTELVAGDKWVDGNGATHVVNRGYTDDTKNERWRSETIYHPGGQREESSWTEDRNGNVTYQNEVYEPDAESGDYRRVSIYVSEGTPNEDGSVTWRTGWDADLTDDQPGQTETHTTPPPPEDSGGGKSGQPSETQAAGNDNCNWSPMYGCLNARDVRSSIKGMISQPGEGDQSGGHTATPNVGAIAVTNPDEFHGSGGGGGGQPYDPRDPDEAFPGGGGGPSPTGSRAASVGTGSAAAASAGTPGGATPPVSAESLDAAMEALEPPPQ